MAGIYIHIPFCATKCIYCDFFSVTVTAEKRSAYLASLSKEYDARLGELQGEEVGTLYIGGGTPSLLSVDEIAGLVSMPVLSADAEVTVEVNPDDVTPDFVDGLKRAGVNRVSMGVQSFCDEELEFLRRRHNAAQHCATGESRTSASTLFTEYRGSRLSRGQSRSRRLWL